MGVPAGDYLPGGGSLNEVSILGLESGGLRLPFFWLCILRARPGKRSLYWHQLGFLGSILWEKARGVVYQRRKAKTMETTIIYEFGYRVYREIWLNQPPLTVNMTLASLLKGLVLHKPSYYLQVVFVV